MIGVDMLMQVVECVLVGNVNINIIQECVCDWCIIVVYEWGYFLVDFEYECQLINGNWE